MGWNGVLHFGTALHKNDNQALGARLWSCSRSCSWSCSWSWSLSRSSVVISLELLSLKSYPPHREWWSCKDWGRDFSGVLNLTILHLCSFICSRNIVVWFRHCDDLGLFCQVEVWPRWVFGRDEEVFILGSRTKLIKWWSKQTVGWVVYKL